MSNALPNPEELLTELRFAQRIALHLVKDHHLADEVAQEAVLAALERRDIEEPRKRAWLAGVVRNLVNNRGREARRRTEREARYAQEAVDAKAHMAENAAEEALQRGEQKARVASAVMDLPEPYRTVVVLRYMEELSPPEVAKELGRPLETIKTQLRRGMSKLREALDAQNGHDGHSWALALLPLVAPRFPLGAESALAATSLGSGSWTLAGSGSLGSWGLALAAGAALTAVAMVAGGFLPDFGAQPESESTPWLTPESDEPLVVTDDVTSERAEAAELAKLRPGDSGRARVALEESVGAAIVDPEDSSGGALLGGDDRHAATLQVVDAATGRPIEGATVQFIRLASPELVSGLGSTEIVGVEATADPAVEQDRMPVTSADELNGFDFFAPGGLRALAANGWAEGVATKVMAGGSGITEFDSPMSASGQPFEAPVPRRATTDSEGQAQLDMGDASEDVLCVEVSHAGHATVEQCMEWSVDQGTITVELGRSAPLTIQRGDLDAGAVVIFAISDMIMNTRRVGMIGAGDTEEVVADLPAGVYRVSGSAHRPGEGATPFLTFHDLVVKPKDNEPAKLRIWDESTTVLRAQLSGVNAAESGLLLRATGRYQAGTVTVDVPFDNGMANVPSLLGPTLQLVVLRGEEPLLETNVQVPTEPTGVPVELTLELPSGGLRVVATDDTGDLQADKIHYALSEVGANGPKPFMRSGVLAPEDLKAGFELEHLPSGRFEFWWSVGRRVGMAPVEIGAGESTLELVIAAPSSIPFTLQVCGCTWPLAGVSLYSQGGALVPFHLGEAYFAAMALGRDQETMSMEESAEPPGIELFLPRGAYRVGAGPAEFSRVDESFSVGSGMSSKTLHAKDDGARVELHFAGSVTEGMVLVSRADTTVDDGDSGHLVELDATQPIVLYLAPGRYRAADADGHSDEFEVLAGVSSVALELQ